MILRCGVFFSNNIQSAFLQASQRACWTRFVRNKMWTSAIRLAQSGADPEQFGENTAVTSQSLNLAKCQECLNMICGKLWHWKSFFFFLTQASMHSCLLFDLWLHLHIYFLLPIWGQATGVSNLNIQAQISLFTATYYLREAFPGQLRDTPRPGRICLVHLTQEASWSDIQTLLNSWLQLLECELDSTTWWRQQNHIIHKKSRDEILRLPK